MNKSYRNLSLGNAALTGISGAATTYSSSAFDLAIDGKVITKAAVAGGTTPTTDGNTGLPITLTANNGAVVVWGVNAAGTVSVYKGDTQALDSAGGFTIAPQFPRVPDTVCAFAYTIHKAGSTTVGTWTFGTSNWNATGLTHAVNNLADFPARPQVS